MLLIFVPSEGYSQYHFTFKPLFWQIEFDFLLHKLSTLPLNCIKLLTKFSNASIQIDWGTQKGIAKSDLFLTHSNSSG